MTPSVVLPLAEVELRTSRSSGPGGQHAQKTETRVEAVFDVEASATLSDAQKRRLVTKLGPVVRAIAQDERSQSRNRELALERLEAQLREALKIPRNRRPTKPTKAAKGAPPRHEEAARDDEAASPPASLRRRLAAR